ncbi:hypothetical protein ACSSS7_008298 [Eimeria intestinalis]
MAGLLATAAAAIAAVVRMPLPSACEPSPPELAVETRAGKTAISGQQPVGGAAVARRHAAGLRLPSRRQQARQLRRLQHQQPNKTRVQQQRQHQQQGLQQQVQQHDRPPPQRSAAATAQASSAAGGTRAAGEAKLEAAAVSKGPPNAASGSPVAPAAAAAEAAAEAVVGKGALPPSSEVPLTREELAFLLAAERRQHRRLLILTRFLLVATLVLAAMFSAVITGAGGLQLRKWAASMLTDEFWKTPGTLAERYDAANKRLEQTDTQAIAAANREAELYNRMQKEMLALLQQIEVLTAQNAMLSSEAKTLQEAKTHLEEELSAGTEALKRAVNEKIHYVTELEETLDRLRALEEFQLRQAAERDAHKGSKSRPLREMQYPISAPPDEAAMSRARRATFAGFKRPVSTPTSAGVLASPASPEAAMGAPGRAWTLPRPHGSDPAPASGPETTARATSIAALKTSFKKPADNASPTESPPRRWGRHTRSQSRHE